MARKRRAPADEEEEEDDSVPAPTQTQRNGRRESPSDEDVDIDIDIEEEQNNGSGSLGQLSKSLVRYALACEYSRTPIKRQDVNQKVLGSHARDFKKVFDAANGQLLEVFGMEMVELPNRDKVTMRQKLAAKASESQNKSSNQWILRNALPDEFHTSKIVAPPAIPTVEDESAYVGLYTTVISIIRFCGGTISESRLDRLLKRMNADQSTPLGTKENMLKRMINDGYIDRIRDTSSGEELVDYKVGPRGKVEVSDDAVADFARKVYGGGATEDLDQRLKRSLGISDGSAPQQQAVDGEAPAATQSAGRRAVGRPRRRREEDEE